MASETYHDEKSVAGLATLREVGALVAQIAVSHATELARSGRYADAESAEQRVFSYRSAARGTDESWFLVGESRAVLGSRRNRSASGDPPAQLAKKLVAA